MKRCFIYETVSVSSPPARGGGILVYRWFQTPCLGLCWPGMV